ncbi:uncharacterized protein LOC135120604 [Zophobas morio]|uniref:uncharacterized protein LOC135120604 n=1 Tax=Zophobas morio TaxID=2755281 RepID=UPI0030831FFB
MGIFWVFDRESPTMLRRRFRSNDDLFWHYRLHRKLRARLLTYIYNETNKADSFFFLESAYLYREMHSFILTKQYFLQDILLAGKDAEKLRKNFILKEPPGPLHPTTSHVGDTFMQALQYFYGHSLLDIGDARRRNTNFKEKLKDGVDLDVAREYFRVFKMRLDTNIKLVNITLIDGPFQFIKMVKEKNEEKIKL